MARSGGGPAGMSLLPFPSASSQIGLMKTNGRAVARRGEHPQNGVGFRGALQRHSLTSLE
jgi:hypothetical protein